MDRFYHSDDEPSPRFGNWADDFNTLEDACHFYGCDSPADIRREQEYEDQLAAIEIQDEMEARGGPLPYRPEEIPF